MCADLPAGSLIPAPLCADLLHLTFAPYLLQSAYLLPGVIALLLSWTHRTCSSELHPAAASHDLENLRAVWVLHVTLASLQAGGAVPDHRVEHFCGTTLQFESQYRLLQQLPAFTKGGMRNRCLLNTLGYG